MWGKSLGATCCCEGIEYDIKHENDCSSQGESSEHWMSRLNF